MALSWCDSIAFDVVKPRLDSLDGSVLTFAIRGASARAAENTIEAFRLAIELGASGIASEAWPTADGDAVLHRDARVGPRFRRRRIDQVARDQLPTHLCSVEDLYEVLDPSSSVSIDLQDPVAFDPVVAAARNAGGETERRLWLSHPELETLTALRRRTAARLVLSSSLRSLGTGPERCAAELRERGIDGLRLHHSEWHGGLVALLHRFERYALGWGPEHEREMAKLVNAGIDAVASSRIDRMTAVMAQFE